MDGYPDNLKLTDEPVTVNHVDPRRFLPKQAFIDIEQSEVENMEHPYVNIDPKIEVDMPKHSGGCGCGGCGCCHGGNDDMAMAMAMMNNNRHHGGLLGGDGGGFLLGALLGRGLFGNGFGFGGYGGYDGFRGHDGGHGGGCGCGCGGHGHGGYDGVEKILNNENFESIRNKIDFKGLEQEIGELSECCCDLKAKVESTACATQKEIMQNRFDNALLQKDMQATILKCCCDTNRNIDDLKNEICKQTFTLEKTMNANTQRIVDKQEEIESRRKDEIIAAQSQKLQTLEILSAMNKKEH